MKAVGSPGHGEKQTRKQEQAIAALLTQPTIAKAAKSCGISEVTLWRWLQEPDFQRSFRQARLRVVEAAISGLQGAAADAVAALKRNLDAEQEGVQVRAAVAILEHATKAIELMDLEGRVQALEERVTGPSRRGVGIR